MPKKKFIGKILSDRMQKTVVVGVSFDVKHPMYGKRLKRIKKFKARDSIGVHKDDVVWIEESHPFSKDVTWKVIKVFREAKKVEKKKERKSK